ncbi:hypothetical protein GCM10018952_74650 [Streptosporangium vulgare]
MGNVIGFQYLPEEQDRDPEGRRSGTLRFFRCAGVGRELLLSLPSLGAVPSTGHPGPHVLLMSGTSWAGTSTRAHVLAPVKAVLKPDPHALEAIRDTVFRTHFLYDDGNTPLSLSGQDQTVRPAVLRQMITRLGRPGRGGLPSPLEQELALIGDDSRRRALLLVGSYREANAAADMLQEMERWRGRVRVLAADDADLEQAVRGGGLGSDGARPRRRRTPGRPGLLRRGSGRRGSGGPADGDRTRPQHSQRATHRRLRNRALPRPPPPPARRPVPVDLRDQRLGGPLRT